MPSDAVTTSPVAAETIQEVARVLDDSRHAEPARRQAARHELRALGVDAALAIRELCRPAARDRMYELWAETDFPHWILVLLFAAMAPPLLQLRALPLIFLLGLG